jgi:hypothetical protein
LLNSDGRTDVIAAVPTYLLDEIDTALDEEMPPEATDEDRDALRRELLAYVAEHGVVPDFTVEKT